ncbi:MFS transporter [Alteromonas lipolytica]|uniref:MFS transporter n=1 Tax=Alteromonas lipolytica TaxID=1856405 RepID=A0A1E8FJ30_9ALTE|nr:MFS transporter [Alteromonas lipolytica]OFI35941.1 MFS transporter [Alteromonas lipolytica]GGF72373.1 MFS transporter [Alteromonas lipolytica]
MAASSSRLAILALSLTYALYFGQLGVINPYLGVFLDGRGFTSAEIGELFAVITLARIIGPSLWAGVADRSGKILFILRLGSALTVLSFIGVFWAYSFWTLTLVMGLMMMFWTAVLPQLEVLTLQTIEGDSKRYGRIRLWGSIGFIVLTVIVGKALDFFSTDAPIYASMLVLIGLFISSLALTQPQNTVSKASASLRIMPFLRDRVALLFLLSNGLLQLSFGAYYGFFALYMRDLGYSGMQTGLLIALGVVVEVGIFLVAQRLIARFGVWRLMVFCLLATGARWLALGTLADIFWLVFFSQFIHALSFGLNHSTSMHFIHHYFPPQIQGRIQAAYVSLAFGLGGAIGNYVSGRLWDQGTGATLTFAVAAACATVGGLVLLLVSPRQMAGKVDIPAAKA